MRVLFDTISGSESTGLSGSESDNDRFRVILPDAGTDFSINELFEIDCNAGHSADFRTIGLRDLLSLPGVGGPEDYYFDQRWLFVDSSLRRELDPTIGQELLNRRDQLVCREMVDYIEPHVEFWREVALKNVFHESCGYNTHVFFQMMMSVWMAGYLKRNGTISLTPADGWKDVLLQIKNGQMPVNEATTNLDAWMLDLAGYRYHSNIKRKYGIDPDFVQWVDSVYAAR